ncbi:carbohydrate binding domain-containing protein [Micromonospora sp. MED01]|uniref:carbohydrate binding domain-containing protein n=1 Tax=Micromonospora alfalfae TaxID=2911212 RepID=UPI001EE7EFEF|nr:carbohydrate binding domain-containing protein [Micromonospora alfalfae]MCG5464818.1 carbohydrate binding domain-containing protein [Micromonospora alfalfae]
MSPPINARQIRRLLSAVLAVALAGTLTALVRPAPATAAPGDLILNGTFDNGSTQPWWTRLASTSTTVNAGQLRVRTSATVGKPVWEDLVGHFEFGVTAAQPYRLQFDAAADVNRSLRVSVSRADTPFTSAVDQSVTLTSSMSRYTFDFVSPFGDPKAVLLFHFGGQAATTVRLDNVSLTPLAVNPATDPILYWNGVLLATYKALDLPPTSSSREAAILHASMHDAAVSVTGVGNPYRVRVPVSYPGTMDNVVAPSLHAAIDRAAYDVLTALYGGQGQSYAQALATAVALRPSGVNAAEVARGDTVGAAAAAANLRARANDGFDNNAAYPVQENVPGAWRPTNGKAAVGPNWGLVTPFALTSGRQFRPGLPAGATGYADLLSKQEYRTQVQEIRDYGGQTSTLRTPEQTQIAFFWANDLGGTYKPPGQLFSHTRIVSEQRQLGILANARLFGLVALALADAAIAAWDAKYQTPIDLWRPVTAIEATEGPGWQPLSKTREGVPYTPPFPAYISGHATFAGAWSAVMKRFFGTDAIAFDATTDDPHAVGVVRHMTGFDDAAEENALSRIYLGVHYRFDADAGLATGRSVGAYVFANRLRQ